MSRAAEPGAESPTSMAHAEQSRRAMRPKREIRTGHDRSLALRIWYHWLQHIVLQLQVVSGGIRATGRQQFPKTGGVLLISNHLSYFDVFVLGLLMPRELNYVARSTLFKPLLAPLIRSVGGFPIQREGMGAQGVKETLKRLRAGGVVTFFPEGTRSTTGELGPLKPGIAALASRAGVPIVCAGIAGTFEAWPRKRLFPSGHAIRIHYGQPIAPDELEGLTADQMVALLERGLKQSVATARTSLARDLGGCGACPSVSLAQVPS